MTIGDAYGTAAQYRAKYNVVSTTGEYTDALLDRVIGGVSRLIDSKVGRRAGFQKDASAVARIYAPSSAIGPFHRLTIDDTVSVSSITVDEDQDNTFARTLAATDYELIDRDAATRPEPAPYHAIELTPWGNYRLFIPGARVKVTGVRGWPAVPSAITEAALELAAIVRVESPRATNRVNEMNQVISTSRAAQGIIEQLIAAYADDKRFAL